ncbi:MAG: Kelch repeat type 1-containing protein [Acidimicrobiaceae bacterium]|nr:Kelch repeat type 1-containing protein [Acidimicrobiaceae bacterium]
MGPVRGAAALAAIAALLSGSAASGTPAATLRATLTTWRLAAPVYRTVAVASAGRIFVLGGHDSSGGSNTVVYSLDPRTGRTALAGSLALATHGAAAALVEGRILVFGGASANVHDTVQAFSPASRSATVVGHLPGVRADTTAVTVGRVTVLLGGFDGNGPQSDVWTTSNGTTFHVVAHLPQPVRYPAVASLGTAVYVFGGLLAGGEYNGDFTDDIQKVSLLTGGATIVGHLPSPLAHAMGSEMGGRLYVFGGSTPSGTSSEMVSFSPVTGAVSAVGRLPEPITDAAVATIGQIAYLLGGISRGPLATITTVRQLDG